MTLRESGYVLVSDGEAAGQRFGVKRAATFEVIG